MMVPTESTERIINTATRLYKRLKQISDTVSDELVAREYTEEALVEYTLARVEGTIHDEDIRELLEDLL